MRFLAVALFSLAVHLPGLLSPPLDLHSYTQTFRASVARNFRDGGMRFLEPEVDFYGRSGRSATEFPVYTYLIALLWPLFGLGDVWGRVLSALFGMLTALYLYAFARDELGEDAGFYGALAFCAIPVRVYFTRTIMPESMALLGVVAGLYHASKPGARHAAAAAAFLALASLLKLPYVYAYLPALWRNRNRRGLAITGAAFAATAAWYLYAKSGNQAVPLSGSGVMAMIGGNALTLKFWTKQFLSRFPEIVATYSGLALMLLALKRKLDTPDRFVLVWLLSTAAWIVGAARYTFIHEYTLVTFAPPVALLIGLGFVELRDNVAAPWARAAALVLLAGVPVHAGLRIRHWYTPHQTFLLDVERAADAVDPGRELWLANETNDPLYLYYLRRKGFTRALTGSNLDAVDGYRAQGVRFLLTARRRLDGEPAVGALLRERYEIARETPDYLIFDLR